MNHLHLLTREITPLEHQVYWATGPQSRGRIRTRLQRPLEDGAIAAELSVAQHLLIHKNVCGHNKTGAGLELHVSFGAIRKLARGISGKAHLTPYALFLRTRFIGANIKVDSSLSWQDAPEQIDAEIAVQAFPCALEIPAVGKVVPRAHLMEQYCQRFERPPRKAWREIQRILGSVEPFAPAHRSAWSDLRHRHPGRHFIHRGRQLCFVVTPPDAVGGLPNLVTVFPTNPQSDFSGSRT